MNYYKLDHAVDTKETGSQYPQVQKMAPGYNYKASNSVHALSRENQEFPSYTPNLDCFILHSKARLTDLLSVAVIYGGFLISPKLKELVEQLNLPKHKFYSAKVTHGNKICDYYWMHIICDLSDFVDYEKSKFFVYNYMHDLGSIIVNSKEELLDKRVQLKQDNPGEALTIWSKKIVLCNSFDTSLDLFEIGNFDRNCYVSERLKFGLEKAGITGIDVQKTNKIIILQ